MKLALSFLLSILATFSINHAVGQEIVVTERGDSIVLYANGTWDYYENFLGGIFDSPEIPMNENKFKKPKSANKKVIGKNDAYEIWFNEEDWKRIPAGTLNPEADLAFQYLHGDVYAMVIYEELEIPEENLSQIAVDNAVAVAPDITMIDREYRVVNNDTIIQMRMDGSTQGMKITYYSYYASGAFGSIQFHCFTGQTLIDKYKAEIESLLNGLVTKE